MRKFFSGEKFITKMFLLVGMVVLIVGVGAFKAHSSQNLGYSTGYYMPYGGYGYGWGYWNSNPVGGNHSNGALIRGTTGDEVYLLENGDKRWVKSPTVFACNGFSWGNIVTVTNAERDVYATVSPLLCPSGTLIKTAAAPVYVVNESATGVYTRRWITTADIFTAAGFNWSNIYTVSDAERDYYTAGTNFDETATARPSGTLLKTAYLPQVWVIDNGQKRWIETLTAFVTNGYSWSNIITVNLWEISEGAYPTGNPVRAAKGTLLKSTGPEVYVVDLVGGTYYKRWITTATIFSNKGYNWANIYTVTPTELGTYTDALPLT